MPQRLKNVLPYALVVTGTPFLLVAGYLTICTYLLWYGLVKGQEIRPAKFSSLLKEMD